MTFQDVQTPEQLMLFLDQSFKYGVVDNEGKANYDSNSSEFQNICNTVWKLLPAQELLKLGVGHCYDQVEIEREWFTKNGFEIKTFWIVTYQEEIENSGLCHAYLVYKENDVWKLFEHADCENKGIYEFKNLHDAVKWQAEQQIKFSEKCIKPINKYVACIKEYTKPPEYINMQEFFKFVDNSKDYEI